MTNLAIRIFETPVQSLPEDLYIPPEAFAILAGAVWRSAGFLLYLVKKNNFDITTTAILPITEQYLTYIDELDDNHFELAGDYLLMANYLNCYQKRIVTTKPPTARGWKNPPSSWLTDLNNTPKSNTPVSVSMH